MMTVIKLVTILVIGFSLGFFLGLLFLDPAKKRKFSPLTPNIPASCQRNYKSVLQSYDIWLSSQGVRKSPVNIDDYFHGKAAEHTTLESEWLRKKVHITCVVFVEREKNVQAALLTWVKHCNSYHLFHAKKPHDFRNRFTTSLNVTMLESSSSWHFLCNIIRYLWLKKDQQMQWILFVNDDMFAVPENLRYIVAHLDFNSPFYFGHTMSLWGHSYNFAPAGYVLSKGSVSLLAANFTSSENCKKGGKYWKKEDFYLGQNLKQLNVSPEDTRDEFCKGRFHGYNLNQLLLQNKLASIAPYWRSSIFPTLQGKNCCSRTSVAFQGIEADKIYMYDYIVNHLNVYTQGIHGNRPAPTPYPPEQVWQKFLRDRGYTHVKNVSANEYLKAWKDKIGEDLNSGKLKKKKSKWHNTAQRGEGGHGEAYAVPFEIEAVLEPDNVH